ncbi:MAG: mechanosensitive ion channel family protein [Nanoarchaeota archaeon]|nr:mechanosensitive ion channel family protein [Nanoarchaeota archaeon]
MGWHENFLAWYENLKLIEFWGNSGESYLIAIGIFLALFLIFLGFSKYIVFYLKKKAKKTKMKWDDYIFDFVDAINWQFYFFIALYIGSLSLTLPDILGKIIQGLLVLFIAYYIANAISRVINHFTELQIQKRKKTENVQNTSMIKSFAVIIKVAIYVLLLLMVLANFGIEITPLIAGLGVGGIAIAIALQSVLGDLFAAFAIYFDKPFKEGDFIIVGTDLGVVEKIGIKTTRIKTLQGQELVISNLELTNSRINNYKKMEERRVAFSIGVEYSTSTKKLKKINDIVKKAVETTKNARLDRVHFKAFGDFSLQFEIVYYVNSSDYNLYMDTQQEINFKIREAFEKERIVFAFPTQTIHLEKN